MLGFETAQRDVKGRNGAARGIRTPDPLITNEVLYQLSYCGILRLLGPRTPSTAGAMRGR